MHLLGIFAILIFRGRRTERPCRTLAAKELEMTEETKSPLYTALRDSLEAKDRETLDTRTESLLTQVQGLLGTVEPVQEATKAATVSVVGMGIAGLVVDPGPEAAGQWGWFWDNTDEDRICFSQMIVSDGCTCTRNYGTRDEVSYDHFAHTPNFPGAALLKVTTGYEAT